MGNVVQNGPVRFYLFNTDINFIRQFYPIIIINIIYLLWFILLFIMKRFLNKNIADSEQTILNKFFDRTAGRIINFVDQIWRYQFLATVWICFIQFYNFSYPEGSNRSAAINGILCILAFLCTLSWPVFVTIYARSWYY